ncbi:MAG: glycoside hydrolase family 25 protein [Bacteroides sp.]|nr:glycoside hydrolase family 25 protein [Bacteroides sp.]
MVKEKKPIAKKTTKKPAPKRTPSKRKAKKSVQKEIPTWVRYLLYVLVIIVFVSGFYYFFIRPYAYRWKPCYGLKGYGICMPSGYQVHGIDVSHYQGDINWKMLEQTRQGQFPIQFIFMKATEGGDYSDDRFTANFDSARAHGFIRGAYHFYNPKTDANKQADFFIQSVKLEPGDLPPVLDIEKKGKDMKKLQSDLKLWLRKVENHYGVKPIIYASYKFKTRYLNDSVFNTYPYWIAHYYVDSVRYEGDWKFWQHTDVGTLPGIEEKVDLNVFNGSLQELNRLQLPEVEE